MFSVKQFINTSFNSNVYLIQNKEISNEIWLVDASVFESWSKLLEPNETVVGIFLTHAHYDHIFFISEIVNSFPACKVYCSEYTKSALENPKLNLSFYHDLPIEFKYENFEILGEGDNVELYDNFFLQVIETPGHNKGSLSYLLSPYFFTGDSLVPGHSVVTKLKSGNKEEAIKSLLKIDKLIDSETIICSGHGPMIEGNQVKIK